MTSKRPVSNGRLEAMLITALVRIAELEQFCASMGMAREEPIEPGAWLPMKSAAFELGVSVQRVSQLVEKGKLRRRPGDGPVLINVRGVENLKMLKAQRAR